MSLLRYLWLINVLFIIDCALNRREIYWFVILVALGPLGALAYGIYFFDSITFPFPLGKTWRGLTGKKAVKPCPRCGMVSEIKAHQDGRQVHYMCELCIERTFSEEPQGVSAVVQAAEAIAQRGGGTATPVKQEPKAEKEEPKAEKQEPKAEKEEPKAEKQEPKAEKQEPKAVKQEPKAEKQEPKAEKPKAEKKKPKAAKKKPRTEKAAQEEIPALPAPKPVEVPLWGHTLQKVRLPDDIEKAFARIIKIQKRFGSDQGQSGCLHQVEFLKGPKFLPTRVSNEQLEELFQVGKDLVPDAMEGHQLSQAQLRNQVKALDVDRAADWLERHSLKAFGEKDEGGKFVATTKSKKYKKEHAKLFNICLDYLLDGLEDPVALYTLTPNDSKHSVSFITGGRTAVFWVTRNS